MVFELALISQRLCSTIERPMLRLDAITTFQIGLFMPGSRTVGEKFYQAISGNKIGVTDSFQQALSCSRSRV